MPLPKYSKLVILVTLGIWVHWTFRYFWSMPEHTCLELWHKFRALLEVYLSSKNQGNPKNYSCEIPDLLYYILCKCPNIPIHNHQRRQYPFVENIDVYLQANIHPQLLSRDITF